MLITKMILKNCWRKYPMMA